MWPSHHLSPHAGTQDGPGKTGTARERTPLLPRGRGCGTWKFPVLPASGEVTLGRPESGEPGSHPAPGPPLDPPRARDKVAHPALPWPPGLRQLAHCHRALPPTTRPTVLGGPPRPPLPCPQSPPPARTPSPSTLFSTRSEVTFPSPPSLPLGQGFLRGGTPFLLRPRPVLFQGPLSRLWREGGRWQEGDRGRERLGPPPRWRDRGPGKWRWPPRLPQVHSPQRRTCRPSGGYRRPSGAAFSRLPVRRQP